MILSVYTLACKGISYKYSTVSSLNDNNLPHLEIRHVALMHSPIKIFNYLYLKFIAEVS